MITGKQNNKMERKIKRANLINLIQKEKAIPILFNSVFVVVFLDSHCHY